ncbi:hypothetical protein GPJ56_006306 [Histomonas meleagridis]|uniref:uncharacterized protein n=1 Tax=Histomonas meleagridis TaxID=135588 RepID=UPI00355A7EF5|nr:hypothetical protein GPJ56_006306 [Histomonas meleagridis]KAH0796877.1 hypothetical protein GO595_010770 [Histomonas meleagridis]
MAKFFTVNVSGIAAICYYVFLIWGIPIASIVSMSVTDEVSSKTRSNVQAHSIWNGVIDKIINKVKAVLPQSEKFD